MLQILVGDAEALWDQLLIHRGLAALERAAKLAAAPGPYALQAAIAACHARAHARCDGLARIAALYGALSALVPSSTKRTQSSRARHR